MILIDIIRYLWILLVFIMPILILINYCYYYYAVGVVQCRIQLYQLGSTGCPELSANEVSSYSSRSRYLRTDYFAIPQSLHSQTNGILENLTSLRSEIFGTNPRTSTARKDILVVEKSDLTKFTHRLY